MFPISKAPRALIRHNTVFLQPHTYPHTLIVSHMNYCLPSLVHTFMLDTCPYTLLVSHLNHCLPLLIHTCMLSLTLTAVHLPLHPYIFTLELSFAFTRSHFHAVTYSFSHLLSHPQSLTLELSSALTRSRFHTLGRSPGNDKRTITFPYLAGAVRKKKQGEKQSDGRGGGEWEEEEKAANGESGRRG